MKKMTLTFIGIPYKAKIGSHKCLYGNHIKGQDLQKHSGNNLNIKASYLSAILSNTLKGRN